MYDISLLQHRFEDRLQLNLPMTSYTSFKIGGPADVVVFPENIEDVLFVLDFIRSHDIPYQVLGNGSNILVSDRGVDGIVLILTKMQNISIIEDKITAAAGNLLSEIAQVAMKHNLSGMEFAGGIPGSVGGAIYMNAGAYGSEVKKYYIERMLSRSKWNGTGTVFTRFRTQLQKKHLSKKSINYSRSDFQT